MVASGALSGTGTIRPTAAKRESGAIYFFSMARPAARPATR
jgi:hypothetical protein